MKMKLNDKIFRCNGLTKYFQFITDRFETWIQCLCKCQRTAFWFFTAVFHHAILHLTTDDYAKDDRIREV